MHFYQYRCTLCSLVTNYVTLNKTLRELFPLLSRYINYNVLWLLCNDDEVIIKRMETIYV